MSKKSVIFALAVISCCLPSCRRQSSPYDNLKTYGQKNIVYTSLSLDTLRLDAQYTSMAGQWHLKDSLLCFVDRFAVGVKEYNLDGKFVGEHIRQGKGPDEVIAASFCSTFDKTNGDFIMEDSNCFIHRFSKDYRKLFSLNKAWFTALSSGFDEKEWTDLYNHPDPEVPEMYEYNFVCERMQSVDSEVIMPIITEHVHYNGYERRYNKGFWTDSYVFIRFRPEDVSGSKVLFGHYPPLFSQKDIPAFSKYDFCADEDRILVTFAADPRIFLMDYNGRVLGSFGFPEEGISGRYPETSSFDEYEDKLQKMMKTYGFYDRLARCGNFIFRTCRLDHDSGTMLQIYDLDYNLVGDVPIGEGFEIIGEHAGDYYAYQRVDLDAEQFIVLKFSL